jgi:AsmA protein
MHTVRPGVDRPEDRPRTAGRPAARPQAQPPARPPYDPDRPPISRTSRSTPEPRRRPWLLPAVAVIATLLGIVGAGIAYLIVAPPVELIRQQVIAQVKAKTGRDLIIAGPTAFKIYPALTLSMRDVTLSATPGMDGAPLVTMAGLDASVRLWPLLSRQISVDQLILRAPLFDLRVDKAGKRSWDFAAFGPPEPVHYAQAKPAAGAGGALPDAVRDFVDNASDPDNPSPQMKAKLARLEDLTLGDVRVEDGTVLYSDARTGANHQVSALDARFGLKSLASPLEATGKLDYAGQTVGFDAKLASLKAILEDRPAKLVLAIKAAPVDARYDGTLTLRATADLEGNVSAKGASLRALVRWLGTELPPAEGFGPVSLSGKLKAAGATYVLSDANLGLDGATATGMALADVSGPRPRINANLKISALDLNRYTLAASQDAPARPKPAVKPRPAGASEPAAPAARSIEDLINGASGPQVKGYTKRAGWGSERIPLDALGSFDADAKLQVGQLRYRDIKAGQSTLTVALKSKVLRTTFDDVQLYDGRGRGFIQIDANPAAPVVGANLLLDGVSALPLLKDAADFDLIAGTGRVSIAAGAQGASEADLVQTLNGKADLTFTNGAIVGYNIPGTIRGLTQGKFSGLSGAAAEKTDFSELAASFAIANGTATNQDLRLQGPLLRVTGAGRFDLPAQTLDYTVKPKVVATLEGQGGANALSGIEVPVRITGPWAKPEFTPDVGGLLKDPNKAVEAAKEIGKQLKENGATKGLGNALKGLFGKSQAPDGATGQGGSAGEPVQSGAGAKAKQLLDKLLKPQQ